jgi:hypothetical protein
MSDRSFLKHLAEVGKRKNQNDAAMDEVLVWVKSYKSAVERIRDRADLITKTDLLLEGLPRFMIGDICIALDIRLDEGDSYPDFLTTYTEVERRIRGLVSGRVFASRIDRIGDFRSKTLAEEITRKPELIDTSSYLRSTEEGRRAYGDTPSRPRRRSRTAPGPEDKLIAELSKKFERLEINQYELISRLPGPRAANPPY